MAVVNTLTAAITAADATGSKFAKLGEKETVMEGTVEVGSSDSIGTTLRILRVPSSFRLTALELSTAAITAATADVGVYEIAANGGTAVDADEFGSAVSLATAQQNTNVLCEAAAADIAKVGKPLWERLGLTVDPGKPYDIVLTLAAAAEAAGTVVLRARGY